MARMTHSIISCLACPRAMPRRDFLNAASRSVWVRCLDFIFACPFVAVGGGVRAPIVAQGGAGTFYAQRTPFRPRRRGFVSTPIFGTAHAGRCVRLAGLCALGFCMHRPSVAATARCAYGVF